MKQAVARASFRRSDNGDRVRRGEVIVGDAGYIDDLARAGVVVQTTALSPDEEFNMPLIEATQKFEHDGKVRQRRDQFRVRDHVARELETKGLAKIVSHMGAARPKKPAGTPPSASPVGPASPQTTATLSEAGEALERTPRRRGRQTFRNQGPAEPSS